MTTKRITRKFRCSISPQPPREAHSKSVLIIPAREIKRGDLLRRWSFLMPVRSVAQRTSAPLFLGDQPRVVIEVTHTKGIVNYLPDTMIEISR